jgi:hypothetical protein
MLPDLRFLIGAMLATTVMGVGALGLAMAVYLAHQTKVGPLEAARTLAFADHVDWRQFSQPEGRQPPAVGRDEAAEAKALLERFTLPLAAEQAATSVPAVAVIDQAPAAAQPEPPPQEQMPEQPPPSATPIVVASVPPAADLGNTEAPTVTPSPPLTEAAVAEPAPGDPQMPEREHVASLPVNAADQEPPRDESAPVQAQPAESATVEAVKEIIPLPRPRAIPASASNIRAARARKARARARAAQAQAAAQNNFPFGPINGTGGTKNTPNNNWPWTAN